LECASLFCCWKSESDDDAKNEEINMSDIWLTRRQAASKLGAPIVGEQTMWVTKRELVAAGAKEELLSGYGDDDWVRDDDIQAGKITIKITVWAQHKSGSYYTDYYTTPMRISSDKPMPEDLTGWALGMVRLGPDSVEQVGWELTRDNSLRKGETIKNSFIESAPEIWTRIIPTSVPDGYEYIFHSVIETID